MLEVSATPYSEIRDSLATGDVVLFSGKSRISAAIRRATGSRWSHVGMVIRPPGSGVHLWESTTLSTIEDLDSGIAHPGVQTVYLSQRLATYPGDIAIRHVEGARFAGGWHIALEKFRHEIRNRPYERSKIELLKSSYDGPLGLNREDLSSIFCSELVAEAYQRIGLLPEDPPSNEYVPADFAGELELLEGELAAVEFVRWDAA